jgi:hypothetical protein
MVGTRFARRRPRAFVAAVGLVGAALLLTGCLSADGSPKVAFFGDAPDPAGVAIPNTTNQVGMYSTEVNSRGLNIPRWCLNFNTGSEGCIGDALPSPPSWVGGPGFTWAPTVRKIAGRYLMMFSASPTPAAGQPQPANCIGAATSPTWDGSFSALSLKWCDTNQSVGWLDPSLFVDSDGTVWLTYAREWHDSAGNHSEIDAQQLSSSGTSKVGAATRLVTYGDVAGLNGDNGSSPFVEQPQLVKDPANNYDLLVSVGTYSNPGYNTIEMACGAPQGSCIPQRGGILPLSSDGSVVGTGGASLVFDASPAPNAIFFHGWPNGPFGGTRIAYWEFTNCFDSQNDNAPCAGSAAKPNTATPNTAAPSTTAPSTRAAPVPAPVITANGGRPIATPNRYAERRP